MKRQEPQLAFHWVARGVISCSPINALCHLVPARFRGVLQNFVCVHLVITHPCLVEAAVLTAHAECFDDWRRLLRHHQCFLQLDLLLQFNQRRRLHAVPEGHTGMWYFLVVYLSAILTYLLYIWPDYTHLKLRTSTQKVGPLLIYIEKMCRNLFKANFLINSPNQLRKQSEDWLYAQLTTILDSI